MTDIIIEAAHYKPKGQLESVRAYIRRGPTYSDCVILTRAQLIESIRQGKNIATGQRVLMLSSTFTNTLPVRLVKKADRTFITSSTASSEQDFLINTPVL